MNKILFTLLLVMVAMSSQAQRNNRNNGGGNRQAATREVKTENEVYTQRAEQYVEQWDLTPETGAKFITLYVEWQEKRMNIIDKYGIEQKAGEDVNFKKLTEEQAENMVKEDFDRLKQQADIDKEYYAKFKEVITTPHAAQVIVQQRNRAAGMMGMFRNMGGGGMGMGGMMMMF